jgi:uncharacterized protein (DUF2235 family)
MSKNIVLLSDGTGNSSSKIFKTNVWRLYQALDLTDSQKQIAYYDDGVGTSSFKPFAILGGVFGFGLKRNVIDIYSFCCRNYRPSDKILGSDSAAARSPFAWSRVSSRASGLFATRATRRIWRAMPR